MILIIGLNTKIGNVLNVTLDSIGLTLRMMKVVVLEYVHLLTTDAMIAMLRVCVLNADVNGCLIKTEFVSTRSRIVKLLLKINLMILTLIKKETTSVMNVSIHSVLMLNQANASLAKPLSV